MDYSLGKTPPRKESLYWDNPSYPWVSIADLVADGNVAMTKEGISEYAASNAFKGRISPVGTLIMSFKLTVGKVSILDINAYHNEAIISIFPYIDDRRITTFYLFKVLPLISQTGDTKTAIKGNTLNSDSLDNLLIPLPPLEEQERIVRKIDELTSVLKAYEIAETQSRILDTVFPEQLKKSILQWAVQGKLVSQDPADEPAEELLKRIRAEKEALVKAGKIKRDKNESIIFRRDNSHYEKRGSETVCIDDDIPFEIPEKWSWERWGNISKSIQYGYNAPAKDVGRVRMVRISDIQNNVVMWDTVPFCDIPENDISAYRLLPRDMLFARTGGTVGKSFLVDEVPFESIYAGYLIRTQYSEELNPRYMKYYMESPLYWAQLKSGTTATAQPNCNGVTLSRMFIPIPPKSEQDRIVTTLDAIISFLSKLTP